MDRWSERYLSTRFVYLLILLPFAWEWPDEFSRDDWGTLDFKVWVWLTFIGTILWQMYRSWRKLWEMKEAYHHLEEERLKKVAPNQITINDNDGPARKPEMPFGVTPPDDEDRPLPLDQEQRLRPEPTIAWNPANPFWEAVNKATKPKTKKKP